MNFLNKNKNSFSSEERQNVFVNFLDIYSKDKNRNNLISPKIRETKQKIVAVVIVLFMFLMIAVSFEIKQVIAVNNSTNLYQNITAGTLTIVAYPDVTFSGINAGLSDNTTGNLAVVNIRDYRGTGAGWTATAISSNFVNGSGGTVIIPNNRLKINCGDLVAYNGASNTGVADCTYTGNFGDGARTVANAAATAGAGAYNLFNNILNLTVLATDQALNYNALMIYTIT